MMVTKRQKIDRRAGLEALAIAKEKNDPLYRKYKKFRGKFMDVKEKIMKKYRKKGLLKAREKMM